MDAGAGPWTLGPARLGAGAGTACLAGVAVVVMGVLGLWLWLGLHLHSLGLVAWLVAEFDEGHQHGQTQAPDKDVEDPCHVAQAEGLGRLVLQPAGRGINTKSTMAFMEAAESAQSFNTYTCTRTSQVNVEKSPINLQHITHAHTDTNIQLMTLTQHFTFDYSASDLTVCCCTALCSS